MSLKHSEQGLTHRNHCRSVNYKLSHARLCVRHGSFPALELLQLESTRKTGYQRVTELLPERALVAKVIQLQITIPLPTLEFKLCFKRKFVFPFSLRVHIHTYTILILLLIFADTTSSSSDTLWSCFYLKFEKAGILFYYLVSHFKDHFIIWSTFISLNHISLRTPEKYKHLES